MLFFYRFSGNILNFKFLKKLQGVEINGEGKILEIFHFFQNGGHMPLNGMFTNFQGLP
jgi:hypothetical protein